MIKCLIWDLDETLWEGTLTESRDVTLRPGALEVLELLDERGVIQSIASRNDPGEAMSKLKELGVDHYFIYPQLGWGSKADSIRQIARELNIGMEAVAFIDDNPFELHEARTCLPDLNVYDAKEYRRLMEYPEFRAPRRTGEALRRRQLMLLRADREEAEKQFAGTREEFLRSCSMELTVRLACEEDLARVCELVERTNQWNNRVERVSEEVVRTYMESKMKRLYLAELQDRFGDHGIVSVAMLDLDEAWTDIRLFCISCRIEGRGIGTAFLGTVLDLVQQNHPGLQEARCGYKSERRNRPALILLNLLGFVRGERKGDHSIYRLPFPFPYKESDWIRVLRPVLPSDHRESGHCQVQQRVINLVSRILGEQEVGPETLLLGTRGVLDSITAVELIVKLEKEFHVVFDEDDLTLDILSTVDNVVRFIKSRIE
ncbi:HAD-IIIC family phosphatase [Paenibacillus sp. J2TS4]|uniref:HAD-IIIC family phosphatase n=1 Tax=Paenibacillus sp. J2TS4 TaxID=2807194 RepID=UPI001B27E423|nr:HAD-IIIC family phosphatase [Paenibacillus sp. J2TS4]GIP35041.1 hypothetical protein J2TS4_42510 [Paenibacillus sp. J2TS4]